MEWVALVVQVVLMAVKFCCEACRMIYLTLERFDLDIFQIARIEHARACVARGEMSEQEFTNRFD